jgi:hypothetical protein
MAPTIWPCAASCTHRKSTPGSRLQLLASSQHAVFNGASRCEVHPQPALRGSQESTARFLAHLVDACGLGRPALQASLQLCLGITWELWAGTMPQLSPLASSLVRRLTEAADAGLFASRDSPLAKLAARLAEDILSSTRERPSRFRQCVRVLCHLVLMQQTAQKWRTTPTRPGPGAATWLACLLLMLPRYARHMQPKCH